MSVRALGNGLAALPTRSRSHRAALSTSAGRPAAGGREIWVSEPKEDRKSIFVGRAAKLTKGGDDEVREVIAQVMLEKRIAKSSHPTMYAWRFQDPTLPPSQVEQGKSDCGESGAGTVLSSLLASTGAINVLLIVTRWYGGSPLGPSRFRHISSVGREALALGGFIDIPSPASLAPASSLTKGTKPKGGKKGK